MKKCLIIGAAMLDIIVELDCLPKKGEDVYATSQQMEIGGCAYNVADILKHLGVQYTFFAPIGSGPYASLIKDKLEKKGHKSPISDNTQDNGYTMCMVESDGERTFLTLPGIECNFQSEWFDKLDSKKYDVVYISGYEIEGEGGDRILDFLQKNPHLEIYYAPGPRITYIDAKKHKRLMSMNPVIHLNEKEVIDYIGNDNYKEAGKQLYSITNNLVIITLGDKGAYYIDKEQAELVSSAPTKVVDTIGAGDSNIAGIIGFQKQGYNIKESIKLANRLSALVVSVKGSTLTEDEFMKGDF